jgi:hypothetical protein
MTEVNGNELLGLFESLEEQDVKVADLAGQMKMLKKDNVEKMKDFAKEKETKPKTIRKLYKDYIDAKNAGDQDEVDQESDDYFTLRALLDAAMQNEGGVEEGIGATAAGTVK